MMCRNCEFYVRYEEQRSKGSALGYCKKKLERFMAEYGELTGIKKRWPEVSLSNDCTESPIKFQ